jgi:hypothetical protein
LILQRVFLSHGTDFDTNPEPCPHKKNYIFSLANPHHDLVKCGNEI